MIIKIKSYKRLSFGKLLQYITNDKKRSIGKENRSFILTHNLKGKTIKEWENQFQENETYRLRKRKDSVYFTHEILSWHKEDAMHLTLAKMEEIAREYMKQRNSKGIYVVVPHFDKEHYHIHICASGIEYKTGKSMRLSKANLSKLKKDIQQYQIKQFPELTKSIVGHGKKDSTRLTENEYQIKYRTGRESEKEKVAATIKSCHKKANSKESFLQSLKDSGLQPYQRSGKTTGVIVKNYKFRFSRLGISEKELDKLQLVKIRKTEIDSIREKVKQNEVNRNR